MRACIISAAMTGSGKTTVTLGLLAALRDRGISVQPFKVGPDFIDPGLHEIAAGVPSHNLDGWMLSRETNERLFDCSAKAKEVAIIEGVMGLFDGSSGASDDGSTAQIAKWLNVPVILVVDAHAMARSAAALVHGFVTFDPQVQIAGIIFNRVAGQRHYQILKDAVTSVPILGWLPANPSIEIPERHLGLLTAQEETTISRIRAIGEFFANHVNLDAILAVLKQGADGAAPSAPSTPTIRTKRVALAHDRAFSFYYQANRLALEEAGADIVEFSPLADRELPEADLLYLGGGYPELYRHELETNISMRASVKRFIESGRRFYAECGGLMYLADSIDNAQMVGVLPAKIEMTNWLVDFGYCEVTTRTNSILGSAGTKARGHQFHYSKTAVVTPGTAAYMVRQGGGEYPEGFVFPNGIASYIHLHFLSNPAIARNMLQF